VELVEAEALRLAGGIAPTDRPSLRVRSTRTRTYLVRLWTAVRLEPDHAITIYPGLDRTSDTSSAKDHRSIASAVPQSQQSLDPFLRRSALPKGQSYNAPCASPITDIADTA
jgi:hypothetical protein